MEEYTFYNYMCDIEKAKPFGDECAWLDAMKDMYYAEFKEFCIENELIAIF